MVSQSDRPDPLSYEPGDRVGICLDLDGTAYRSGSVFVETMAVLPHAPGFDPPEDDRRHLRRALSAVAAYSGGRTTAIRWELTMAALDALTAFGAAPVSRRLLARIVDRRAGRASEDGVDGALDEPSRSARPPVDPSSYRRLRYRLLATYGAFLRGRRTTEIERLVEGVVDAHVPVDRPLQAVLERAGRETDVETYLVTDAPDHVARAYARKLTGDPDRVCATGFETDEGRFTGAFEPVNKRRTIDRLRAERGWEYVVAAGDSAVDVPMATVANLFFPVCGQGDVDARFDDLVPILPTSIERLRGTLDRNRNAIVVPADEDLSRVLTTGLRAVGVLP